MYIMTPIYYKLEDKFLCHENLHNLPLATPDFPQIFVFLPSGRVNDLDSCGDSLRWLEMRPYEPLIDTIISSECVEIERHLYNDWG